LPEFWFAPLAYELLEIRARAPNPAAGGGGREFNGRAIAGWAGADAEARENASFRIAS
jgi:hypothetical protein